MKKLVLIAMFAWFCQAVIGQTDANPVPDKSYGEKGTKTVTKSLDKSFNPVTTIEYKDNDGYTRKRITWTKSSDGKYKREEEDLSPGGKTTCSNTAEFDANMRLVVFKQRKEPTLIRGARGEMSTGDGKYDFYWFPAAAEATEKKYQDELKSIEENNATVADPTRSACSVSPSSTCQPKARLFAGYSYLNSSIGGQSESFPLGVAASAVFNITSHISAGVNASYHTKKINDENLINSFLFAEGKYTFGKVKNCSRTFAPDLHILVGLANEKYGKSKGSGFAYGVGAGLDIRLSKRLGIGTQADLIYVDFKNSEENAKFYRACLGMKYGY